MDREAYNNCMRPYMAGSKTKKQRQHDMCVGAKLCSGKVTTEAEAEKICSAPRLPKWARQLIPKEKETAGCEERMARARNNLNVIALKVREGEASEVKEAAAQAMNDIYTCFPEPAILEITDDAMEQYHQMTKGFIFKGEAKELERKLETLREVLV